MDKRSLGASLIVFPTPVWCVGTYDADGRPNVMTIAAGGLLSARPPCLTVSLREATYTYGSILARQAYTINVPSERYVKEADYFGIVSGRDVDKFAATGLTPVRSELIEAPYVGEFPMVLECRLAHHYTFGSHTHFVGEILDVKVDEAALTAEGQADVERVRPIVYSPGASLYHGVGEYLGKAFEIGKKL